MMICCDRTKRVGTSVGLPSRRGPGTQRIRSNNLEAKINNAILCAINYMIGVKLDVAIKETE